MAEGHFYENLKQVNKTKFVSAADKTTINPQNVVWITLEDVYRL